MTRICYGRLKPLNALRFSYAFLKFHCQPSHFHLVLPSVKMQLKICFTSSHSSQLVSTLWVKEVWLLVQLLPAVWIPRLKRPVVLKELHSHLGAEIKWAMFSNELRTKHGPSKSYFKTYCLLRVNPRAQPSLDIVCEVSKGFGPQSSMDVNHHNTTEINGAATI